MKRLLSFGKRGALVTCILLVAVSAALVLFVRMRETQVSGSVQWVTFTDPNGFYTVELPQSWRVYHFEQGHQVEGVQLSTLNEFSVVREADGTGIEVFINVLGQDSLQARHDAVCNVPVGTRPTPTTEIDGIPADYQPVAHNSRELYIFHTTRADYEIGIRKFHSDPAKSTPDEQAVYSHLLRSFKPIPATPLQC